MWEYPIRGMISRLWLPLNSKSRHKSWKVDSLFISEIFPVYWAYIFSVLGIYAHHVGYMSTRLDIYAHLVPGLSYVFRQFILFPPFPILFYINRILFVIVIIGYCEEKNIILPSKLSVFFLWYKLCTSIIQILTVRDTVISPITSFCLTGFITCPCTLDNIRIEGAIEKIWFVS